MPAKKSKVVPVRDPISKPTKVVKDYHKGTIAKNSHDVASKNVKKKFGKANG